MVQKKKKKPVYIQISHNPVVHDGPNNQHNTTLDLEMLHMPLPLENYGRCSKTYAWFSILPYMDTCTDIRFHGAPAELEKRVKDY